MYSTEELSFLRAIIEDVAKETEAAKISLPFLMMGRRLFYAYDCGERDPVRLRTAALSAEIIQLRAHQRHLREALVVRGTARSKPRL